MFFLFCHGVATTKKPLRQERLSNWQDGAESVYDLAS